MITLLVLVALAGPPSDEAVASGLDLIAWRALPEADADLEVQRAAWHAFIEQFPSSALAEVLWGRLRDLGERPVTPDQQRLDRSLQAHRRALEEVPTAVVIGALRPDGGLVHTPRRPWEAALGVGLAWSDDLYAGFGLRVGRGATTLQTTLQTGPRWVGEAAFRVSPARWRPVFGEVAADTAVRAGLRIGVRLRLSGTAAIEVAAGALAHLDGVVPSVRLQLVQRMADHP